MKSLLTLVLSMFIGSITAQTVVSSRTADLQPGGYEISGNAILEELSDGQLQLRLDDEFTTPAGPDVQILLSNDPQSISNALFIADIGTDNGGINHFNGAITFDVPAGITIDQYDYVVFYCVAFGLHWADGNFGMTENVPTPAFECKESLTATTNWVPAVTVCTNDGLADFVPLKNSIGAPVGENYAFIITDANDAIDEVILVDSFNFEGSGAGINRVYGVSYNGNLVYNIGDPYTSITADSCAIVSSSEVFLTITKEHCKANISGQVTRPDGSALSGFEISLNDDISTQTNTEGIFEFNQVSTGISYTITPQGSGSVSQGITTSDLVAIRKHLLGIEAFSNSFQSIAADVSNNGSVSTKDIIELQRLILGIDDGFVNNNSWRFVNTTDLGSGTLDLKNYAESFIIDSLIADSTDIDFVGVKIGDVSNAANNGLQKEVSKNHNALPFTIKDVIVKAGEKIEIPVSTAHFNNIEAFQFTIKLDGLEFDNMTSEVLRSDQLQFAQLNPETITTLWSSATTINKEGHPILTLNLRAKRDIQLSEGISFNSKVTPAIAYTSTSESKDIDLHFQAISNRGNTNELLQNAPNPFTNETSIPFYLMNEGNVTLNLYDVTGKMISTQSADYEKGDHSIVLNNFSDLPQGILYYQMVTSEFKATKKMIRVLE